MAFMRHIRSAIAVGTVVGALGLGGLAYASTTGPSSATPAAKTTHAGHATLLRRAIYAQIIVEGKGHTTHTITYERGTFTGISAGALHLTRPDGVLVSAPITTTTKFKGVPQASLVSGMRVRIVERDGSTTSVVGHSPKPSAPKPSASKPVSPSVTASS